MVEPSKILIVDDELFNVDLLEQQLELLGHEARIATNGQEALELVEADRPDLILLDVMMPIMDGFTACKALKESEDTRLIPIIMMTALGATEDRVRGFQAGADDFLTKPVDERELFACIERALRFKHSVDRRIQEHRRIGDQLSKFVPAVVRRAVAADPDAPELAKRDRDVSVLFVDICGFTRISGVLSTEALNELVERYFSAFLDRIDEAGGDITETSGDGLMAVFQHEDLGSHASLAVGTAIALFDVANALNQSGPDLPLAFHMGINSGVASVGSTRYEGSRGARWVFTADGLMPNLAARLADLAKEDELVVGPETARRVADRFDLQPLGPQILKNVPDPVEVFRVNRHGF